MSNKAELLKKIKALADRGVDGERESAQTLLARLMEQYGISETDLEEERRETAWFRYSQETERRLLNQIIYMVTGRSGFGCVGSYSGRKRKETGVNCTAAERLEIEANYKFFKVALELYERVTPFGAPYIVAKAGFLLQAVIMPCDVISAQFVQRLQELTRQCAVSLDLREQERERQAAAESAGQFKVDPETGAIIEPESEAGDDD